MIVGHQAKFAIHTSHKSTVIMKPIKQVVHTFFAIYDIVGDEPKVTILRSKAKQAFKEGKQVFEHTSVTSQITKKIVLNTTISKEW